MKVEKARELGFCFGVRRALKIIESAANGRTKIVTLGPIVHNKTVVARLKALGVGVIDDIEKSDSGVIAVSSHGVAPATMDRIQGQGAKVIDTTCPIVRSAQKAAQRLAGAGFSVVIYGEANHPEVRGLLGWAGKNAIASMNANEVPLESLLKRVGILSQTTQNRLEFISFVNSLTARLLPGTREIRIINTLCQETLKRQSAAIELAKTSDLMIVVGGHNSANTRHLAEVCSPIVQTHHIENAEEIDAAWLRGKGVIGITAGASTPDEAIEQVIAKIKQLSSLKSV
ncbi:MAG: 4-hydroxy-3-methylbut-2-enyl diphosphate reductase [Dehalococcoidia bacterium]|nr:4-hydroxy-3-methylbut-2-enyl diphosphate reductase [Dehalococcoidia bacterium]MDD5495050.1 4-hydroxy-3-methylbut-2-enyl diphosphate reductase [Dehalococcoidia bacterium]